MVDPASGAFHDIIDWDHATKMTKKELELDFEETVGLESELVHPDSQMYCEDHGFRYHRRRSVSQSPSPPSFPQCV